MWEICYTWSFHRVRSVQCTCTPVHVPLTLNVLRAGYQLKTPQINLGDLPATAFAFFRNCLILVRIFRENSFFTSFSLLFLPSFYEVHFTQSNLVVLLTMSNYHNLDGDFTVESDKCQYTPEAIVSDYT